MSTPDVLISAWFGLAILVEVVSSVVLRLSLRRRGVKLVFGLTGMPGYLERAHLMWCRSQGRRSTGVLVFRLISLVNVIAAAVVAIPLLAGR